MAAGTYQGAYSADKVIRTIGGVSISGGGDDMVSAEYEEDRSSAKVGADGEVAASINPSMLGTITFTLSAASSSNDELSEIVALNSAFSILKAIPISVIDLSGRTVITANKCWLKTAPPVSFGKDVGEREWVFYAADLQMFVGGNN